MGPSHHWVVAWMAFLECVTGLLMRALGSDWPSLKLESTI